MLGDELGLNVQDLFWRHRGQCPRCRMRTAGSAPMTATSAPGQANTFVAPRAREFMAM
jgi:hypothetical protein